MRPWGLILTAISLLFPFIWFGGVAQGRDVVAVASQYMGIAALIAMAIVQVIATRFAFVEWLFGGLDRSYIVHKWLGILAMGFILLHDTIDAEMPNLGRQNMLEELAETLGELSLYGLLILVVITIATFIPYHLWRWTHRFMGAFFVAGSAHYLFILKPFKNGDPLGLYVSAFCVVGILAFTWRLLPSAMRPSRSYVVEKVETTGNALSIEMTPDGKPLRHRAGQFAFVSFDGSEPHPFTISSASSEDGRIRMSVARLGDYTSRLHKSLKTGTHARVEGPFGHFECPKKGPQIWVAAGIGITPFLAWSQNLAETAGPVHLFYCTRDLNSAAHLEEIRSVADSFENFVLRVHTSSDQGRVSADMLLERSGLDANDVTVSFCGPKQMRKDLLEGFKRQGVTGRRFRYEEFEIRTGIGLRRMAELLFKRINLPDSVQSRLPRQ
ncbi:ferric reductase-like transmembrane domain-containing protein [Shimia sp.]|uniref:ferredoxin reductase family protein n=1 Tax=Shimia sp. TaxID=1954381 RepID=UPI003298F84E